MQAFLDKTAEYIVENYHNNLDNICFVLPNRRAGLFLKKHLAKRLNKTIWSPSIFSIEDFVVELSGLNIIDPVYLQFELYEVHKEVEGGKAQEFNEFLNWGQVLIYDFNEIDLSLVDPEQIFSYLTDTKAMVLWNPNGEPLTDFETRYLHFYNSLKRYYYRLVEKLLEKQKVYQGLAYRKLSEQIEEKIENIPWKKVVFAGFNALTASEEKIIFTLKDFGKADLLWESDRYYLDNKIQEAGTFIRKYKNKIGENSFNWIGNHFANEEKKITIISVPQNIGQVKTTGKLLEEIAVKDEELEKTAVVLNDETLMLPLLNSIPAKINKFNLTLGLQLKYTPLFRLIEGFFIMNENTLKFDKTGEKSLRLYYKDIIKILEHPYIKSIIEGDGQQNTDDFIIDKIKKSNKIFFSFEELKSDYFYSEKKLSEDLLNFFEPAGNNPGVAIDKIVKLFKIMKISLISEKSLSTEQNSVGSGSLELEYLFYFSRVFRKLKNILSEYPYLKEINTLREIFNQIVKSTTIPFYGEPLHGLQIMGMLETRTLDFENIIMLSVNEDMIPSGKAANSFIPFEIKREFKLPTIKEKNAVFAYHFYRILQRAKNVYLLHNTESGEMGGGDKSRFISQIQYELPKYNSKISIEERVLSLTTLKESYVDSIEIPKTKDILNTLNSQAISGFSPSALNTYRNCSLQFYFKYVAGIKETEEVEETIEATTLGTVVHDVLRELYAPFVNKSVSTDDIKLMHQKVEVLLKNSFKKYFESGEVNYGKNLLIVKVSNLFIKNFLKKEETLLNSKANSGNFLIIKNLENEFISNLIINNNSGEFDIKLRGTIDRVDKINNSIRIIDYKTGKVEQKDLKFKDWDDLQEESKLDKCFQLLFYSYIYSKSTGTENDRIIPGIISFRNISSGFMNVLYQNQPVTGESIDDFEIVLKQILSNIYNIELAFRQTEHPDNCEYCPFTIVCKR